MNIQEIKQISRALKLLIPTHSEPITESEWAFIGSMFNDFKANLCLKALKELSESEDGLKLLKTSPYISLKSRTIELTEKYEKEKRLEDMKDKYENAVDVETKTMKAINKATGEYEPTKNRPMTKEEEAFWVYGTIDLEEYKKYKRGESNV